MPPRPGGGYMQKAILLLREESAPGALARHSFATKGERATQVE